MPPPPQLPKTTKNSDNQDFKNSLATLLQKNKPQKQKTIIKEEPFEEEKEKIKFSIFDNDDSLDEEEEESPTKLKISNAPTLDNVSYMLLT